MSLSSAFNFDQLNIAPIVIGDFQNILQAFFTWSFVQQNFLQVEHKYLLIAF